MLIQSLGMCLYVKIPQICLVDPNNMICKVFYYTGRERLIRTRLIRSTT